MRDLLLHQRRGFGVLEDGEVDLTAGKAFIVPGIRHSMRSDGKIYVSSFPAMKEE